MFLGVEKCFMGFFVLLWSGVGKVVGGVGLLVGIVGVIVFGGGILCVLNIEDVMVKFKGLGYDI